MTSLEVRISKHFFSRHHQFALDVNFTASAGVTVLFGPSGSGKTTILDCIAGLLTPDAGEIRIAGENSAEILFSPKASRNLPAHQRGLGYVFQNLALFPHLTVEKNVSYGLSRFHKPIREQQVTSILESFRIAHLAKQYPDRISGGERQRVALARSLVTKPRALLLDEPLSALDFETKSQIIGDLCDFTRDHRIPIIYVTHAIDEVFAVGETVITLKDGKIVKRGRPGEVLASEREQLISQLQSTITRT
jgi:molybdate transport system ATP-binding protein